MGAMEYPRPYAGERHNGDNGEYRDLLKYIFRFTAAIAFALFAAFALGYYLGTLDAE